jgi:hypothetical protein
MSGAKVSMMYQSTQNATMANGDICDDDIAAECKYNESGKEEEDGDDKEDRQWFDEL